MNTLLDLCDQGHLNDSLAQNLAYILNQKDSVIHRFVNFRHYCMSPKRIHLHRYIGNNFKLIEALYEIYNPLNYKRGQGIAWLNMLEDLLALNLEAD